jgi:RimJ/RimL family protein N-acetyltransferase
MISTERLILREWRDDDLAPFAAMNACPRVREYFCETLTREESDAQVETIRAEFAEKGYGLFALELKATGEFIGFTGLHHLEIDVHFTPAVEVGWRLAEEHWGKGYAPEAARAALDFGFNTVGLEEIVAMTVPANKNSRRVMEKLGMTYDPEDDFNYPTIPRGHPLRRHVLYRMKNPAKTPE